VENKLESELKLGNSFYVKLKLFSQFDSPKMNAHAQHAFQLPPATTNSQKLSWSKRRGYAAANRDWGMNLEHRQHKGLNNWAEKSHQPTRMREQMMRRFKSARHLQRFTSFQDQVANLFMHCRYNPNAQDRRQARTLAFEAWEAATGNPMMDRLVV
jgi:DDE domain